MKTVKNVTNEPLLVTSENKTYEELKSKFHAQIVPYRKTGKEIIEYLDRNFSIVELKLDQFPAFRQAIYISNFINFRESILMGINEENLLLRLFKVMKDERSRPFYDTVRGDDLIVAVEENVGVIDSDCSEMNLLLFKEIGISREHYEKETSEYRWYLQVLDLCDKGLF